MHGIRSDRRLFLMIHHCWRTGVKTVWLLVGKIFNSIAPQRVVSLHRMEESKK